VSRLRTGLLACLVVLASPLVAHELGMMQVEALFHADGTYVVDLMIDRDHLPGEVTLADLERSAMLLFDGQPVPRPRAEVADGVGAPNITRLRLRGAVPQGATQFAFADDAVVGVFVLKLRNERNPVVSTQWVEGGQRSEAFALDRPEVRRGRWEIIKLYAVLGFTHILPKGLDHVLFVLGIFLLSVQLRPVLWQVTAFTVAHTITLALTIYGFVALPPSIVEPLIALSIAYVAIENLFTKRLHAWRAAIIFLFGLLHGMGFAGVLKEIGLPRSEFVPALLAFNAGVEVGQVTVILIAFLLVGLPFRNKPWYRTRVVIPGSLLIAATGLFWFVQRTAGAFGGAP